MNQEYMELQKKQLTVGIDIATVQGTPAMQPEELGKGALDINEESGKNFTLKEFSDVSQC